ncbi:MAG: family beta-propeller repeat protein [Caulobacteraceae bacterium]|nr:family beta-propeller repeat protein [Caulobacteraceae bacterium]
MPDISSFALQNVGANYQQVLNSPFDLFITDGAPLAGSGGFPDFTDAQIAALEAQGRIIAGYVDAAVTDASRYYWDPRWTVDHTDTGALTASAPAWLVGQPLIDFGGFNGTQPDARIVKYWDPDWRSMVIAQAVNLIDRGYNAVFLDDIGRYYDLGSTPSERQIPAQRMIDLVAAVSEAIKHENPNAILIVNGDPYIGTDAGGGSWSQAFSNAIDGMVLENLSSDAVSYAVANILPNDPVFVLTSPPNAPATSTYFAQGLIPYASPTFDYSSLGAYQGPQTTGPDHILGGDGPNQLTGDSGDDILEGKGGDDRLDGGVGLDTASYASARAGVHVSLLLTAAQATGAAGTDTLVSIENLTGSAFDDQLTGNGGANVLSGGAGVDVLTGGAGNDSLDGGADVDTAVFSGAKSAYGVTSNGGAVTVTGPDGTDTLTNVEFLQFSDQTFHFRPGVGTTVNFSAATSTYAGALRDFDGNDLGGSGAWVLAGHVDIQGDGDQEYILFNRQIGRWATIGPAADGKVYFDDHGWAGDTRVVGIYIDPEVVADPTKAGGPFDSQRRFQNDLNIGNLKGILGAGDYNHDGLQEVYFSLTDGSAYLHAYMHADGNIQYANYQSQQQVTDYLTANGFTHATWDGWF